MQNEEKIQFDSCDKATLPCKNCKWGNWLNEYWEKSCAKYSNKPYDVYYRSFRCPKFEPVDK